jgi:type I restriction enzyme S subunit
MKLVSLGEVCTVLNGGTPDTKIREFWDGPHAWITPAEMGNLTNPFLAISRRTLSDEGLRNSSAQLLPRHSVIMSSRAPIGHLVINEVPMASNQGCKGLIPNSDLNYKYLYYFLFSNKEYLNSLGSGTTFAEISGTKLKTVQIPLPSLEKQQEIVEKLDSAFAEIHTMGEAITSQIKSTSELFAKICLDKTQELKPTGFKMLKEIATVITKGTTPTSLGYKFTSTGINFLKVESLDENGGYIRDKFAYIDNVCHASLKRSQLMESDVLVSIAGALGRTAIVTADICPANVNQALSLIRLPKESEISPKFLFALFQAGYFKFELDNMGAGAAQQNLSLAQIGSLKVPIFPIPKQNEFIDFLVDLRGLITDLKSHLEDQYSLKLELQQSILTTMFMNPIDNELVA